ncbi:bifunctional ornithine acetyltransferase/N-acetylglutamate synthase, partial [Chloroflexota bacterium]
RSGVAVEEGRIELAIGGVPLFGSGHPLSFNEKKVVGMLDSSEVFIDLDLNLGDAAATAWGCDLSEEYVTINSQYTT